MKKIVLAIALIAMGLSTGCSDFLDVRPEGKPNPGSYFNTDQQAMNAIAGVYRCFDKEELWGRDLFWEQGCGDDMVCSKFRWPNFYSFEATGYEDPITGAWSKFNEYVMRSNFVVQGLKAKGVDKLTDIEKRTLGEALFMRAYMHFHLAYRHGRIDNGVPFMRYEDYEDLNVSTIPPQAASVIDNYKIIEQDIDEAEKYLPFFEEYGPEDYGRVHKVCCWALKVKLWAYWAYHDKNLWSKIPPMVDRIEKEGHRGLLDDFADVFLMKNNWSKEYIWSATGTGRAEGGPRFPGVCLMNKGWGIFNGWGSLKPTRSLYEEYSENDRRRDISVYSYGMEKFKYFGEYMDFTDESGDVIRSGFMFGKYMEPYGYGERKYDESGGIDASATVLSNPYVSTNGNDMTTDMNTPLIRHAEMVLFKAEALIRLGDGAGAAKELNRLTKRCGLGEKYTVATMKDLMHERRCELAGEFYDRFMDLKRWAKDYPEIILPILNAPQYGRLPKDPKKPYDAVSNPWDDEANAKPIWPNVAGKRTYDPAVDLVFPFPPDEVRRANGALKQNPGY